MKPKLLVVELWGLGDLVIATPFIRAASEKFEVTLLAKPFAREMRPRFWPTVDVVSFTAPWTAFHFWSKYNLWRWPWRETWRLCRELRAKKFDCAVSARWDPRNHFLLKIFGARERLGFSRLKSRHFLTQDLPRPDPLAHRYEYWRVAGAGAGPVTAAAREAIVPPAREPASVVLIHSGARLPLRVWPLENFQELARRLRQRKFTVQIACDAGPARLVAEAGRNPRSAPVPLRNCWS